MANTKIIRIEIDGFPDDAYDVVSFRGSESLSNLFRYSITLAAQAPTQDFDAILEAKAHLFLGDPAMHVRGILSSIQQGYEGAWKTESGALTRVDVVLVPEVYKLSLTSQTRIFQEMSVPDIVKKILNEHNIPGGDTDWKLSGTHEAKEFILQYQESDLDFCQRLLDYDGIHYHFELGEDNTKIVFGDSNSAFGTISGESTIRLGIPDPELGESGVGAWGHEQTVTRFQSRQRIVPKRVILQDYNFQKSSLNLKVEGEVKAPKATIGLQYLYGEHYKVKEEGNTLTKIRHEEILARKRIYFGGGTVRRFYAGGCFTLTGVDEIDTELAKEYLLTETTSEGSQPVEHVGRAKNYHYSNEFTCLDKAAIEFRPERRTPWPQIGGVFHAKVCAAPGGGQYAHIDDRGRYKVRFLFDIGHAGDDDKASCWVRKCESYVGKDFGFHAPLLKDFEVLVAFENGDPDRPIIIGCAYNTDFPSPTKDKNHAQSVWRSAGANEIRYDDTSGEEHIFVHATKDWNNVVEHDHKVEIKNDDFQKVINNRTVNVDVNQKTEIGGDCDITIKGNYTEKIDGDKKITVGGTHTESITGDVTITKSANETIDVSSDQTISVGGDVSESVGGNVSRSVSGKEEWTIGGKVSMTISGALEQTVSAASQLKAASIKQESKGVVAVKAGGAYSVNATGAAKIKSSAIVKVEASGMVSLKGALVKVDGSGGVNIKGGVVKLKGSGVDAMDGSLKVS